MKMNSNGFRNSIQDFHLERIERKKKTLQRAERSLMTPIQGD